MTDPLAALADPTRRAVFEALAEGGAQTVSRLASRFPVSRPAVSQHLRVLEAAGLVVAEPRGRERLYRADPHGLNQLHAWLDGFWQTALDGYAERARRGGPMTTTRIRPVVKTVDVPLPPDAAFALFTEGIAQWWPLDTHSISADDDDQAGERPVLVRVEAGVGGRVVETTARGEEHSWAEVLAWDPPHRLALSWHPNVAPLAASRVEVRFTALGEGTRLTLEHSGWEEFGDRGERLREGYASGWDPVLSRFVRVAG